jgi:hypothetical protein
VRPSSFACSSITLLLDWIPAAARAAVAGAQLAAPLRKGRARLARHVLRPLALAPELPMLIIIFILVPLLVLQ